MGIVAWELYHLDCYRQWPELPEVTIKSRPRKTARSFGSDRTRALAHMENPPTTACSRVFAIAELAEDIFLRLQQSDLLCRAQQVCRQWRIVIMTTRSIREHLFFDSISHIRPRLIKFSNPPVLSTEQGHSWAEDEQTRLSRSIIENPFVPLLSMTEPWPEPFARPDASWRRMLITQPGVAQVSWHYSDSVSLRHVATSSQGVLMNDSAQHRAIPVLRGWSVWKAFENHHQLQALKIEMRLSLETLQAMHEWSCASELPEYEVWEEKTGRSMRIHM